MPTTPKVSLLKRITPYDARLDNVPPQQQRCVENRYTKALWYAWGRLDQAHINGRLAEDASVVNLGQQYAGEHAYKAFQFYTEQSGGLESILGSWETFAKASPYIYAG